MPATPLIERTMRVRLQLTPEENNRLRGAAGLLGQSAAAFAREAVLAAVEAAEANGRKPAKPRRS